MLLKAYQTILQEDHQEKVTLKVWSLGKPQQKKIVAWFDFFLENGRYKPNEQISKEKK